MIFKDESEFETAVIRELQKNGWEKDIFRYPTEEDLINNWANIIFENNREIDRLNNMKLTDTEMKQILDKVRILGTPLKLNKFINNKIVSIIRDNIYDKLHFGKEISLKIYDRQEIGMYKNRYQIVKQVKFKSKDLNNRRYDLLLLINGMPMFYIELNKSGESIAKGYYKIEKYSYNGIFTGIFSLIQIFVVMQPEETIYFANPGINGIFNRNFYFHWADFNNNRVNSWKDIINCFLLNSIAHKMIGFYTVADESDGILKVMRSYQYFAVNAIYDIISKADWERKKLMGGYVWHTTGSGKTMTSFKVAQLIASTNAADKIIFLIDRIELGIQSFYEYRSFAEDNEEVQWTEDTYDLILKLKSKNFENMLIVTSIQKMSNIRERCYGVTFEDIEYINSKRIVFIVDEAHRSTFGVMLCRIKKIFYNAIFFGFTGTPICNENKKKENTTFTIFGNELHRYNIADGIYDKNVLAFHMTKVLTYSDINLRKSVAMLMSNVVTEEEITKNSDKSKIYYYYMDPNKVKMAGYYKDNGKYVKGIEDYLPIKQYDCEEHRSKVVKDIINNWKVLSKNSKFHAIFATNSIVEAIEYYRLFKYVKSDLKVTALFDQNIDNKDEIKFKEESIIEILEDYNARYKQNFALSNYGNGKFKKDISARLAHKNPYNYIEKTPEKQIDILIVVDQMLTGFDSKWINTIYIDKVLKYENIIQTFSRTNRLFGRDKPFGIIRYYRKLNTMERNIKDAVNLYSSNKSYNLFVKSLDYNLEKLNEIYNNISKLIILKNVDKFYSILKNVNMCIRFVKLFNDLNKYLELAKIQGFIWEKKKYFFNNNKKVMMIKFSKDNYSMLVVYYKRILIEITKNKDILLNIADSLIYIDNNIYDINNINLYFNKYFKVINENNLDKDCNKIRQEKCIFVHKIKNENNKISEDKFFREYIDGYQFSKKNEQVDKIVKELGVDSLKLEKLMNINITEDNINEYGRFDNLKKTVDIEKAKNYFETLEEVSISKFRLSIKIDKLLKDFIIKGGFDISKYNR